jgi:hypothetical protein
LAWPLRTLIGRNIAFSLRTSSATPWPTSAIVRSGWCVIPHANFWLEESLCETSSLFTLRAMSRSWRTAPPYPSWRDYAPWLNAYAEQRLRLPEHQLPSGKPFAVWFQENQPALRQNSAIRIWNTIFAIRLLPVFEAEPRGWETVTFLNRGLNTADDSLSKHLAKWRSQCPADLHPFVTKLAQYARE